MNHDVGISILRLDRIEAATLETEPFCWATVDGLFDVAIAKELVAHYPLELYRRVVGNDGEKSYEYEVRELVPLGDDRPVRSHQLAPIWRTLATGLASGPYRAAVSKLTGCDLSSVPIEVNVFHYGPGASLGAHSDLADKIVTHVLYFNETWPTGNGGCLRILRSADIHDFVTEILPIVGTSSVVVRSERSFHGVTPVSLGSNDSRRSVTVTFYRRGSVSTMWPPGEDFGLHPYRPTRE
jgi:hypothetical protein